jgi:hypothetical protein
MSPFADPAPGILFIDAIRILEDRYGIENIEHHPTTGELVIYLPEREGAEILWPSVFTDCQAIFGRASHLKRRHSQKQISL